MSIWRSVLDTNIEGAKRGTKACVFFFRYYKDDWGYMGMRDYKTEEPTDRFELRVIHYMNGRCNAADAGYKEASFKSKEFNKDIANKIWYNLKNRYINYNSLKDMMEAEGLLK